MFFNRGIRRIIMISTSAPCLVKLVNPLGQCHAEQKSLARRLDSLRGKSIGFINTGKPNVGHFLAQIEEMIRADYPGVKTHNVRKDFTSAKPIAHELDGKVHAVANAWGD